VSAEATGIGLGVVDMTRTLFEPPCPDPCPAVPEEL
jgi:hypothetical protein